jgi:5'-nucleotidase
VLDRHDELSRLLGETRTAIEGLRVETGKVEEFAEGEAFVARIDHADHELGYAIYGTPCDCVILGANVFEPDLVVAGPNPGANLGAYVLARSGTASAAIEAACLGVPGIALSMDTLGLDRSLGGEEFERACGVAKRVVERAMKRGVFDGAESRSKTDGRTEGESGANGIAALNVNVPRPDRPLAGVSITRPTPMYGMDARFEDGEFRLHNPLWAGMAAREIPDAEGTDRRAILDEKVSISPLALPHAPIEEAVLSDLEGVFAGVSD